MRLAALIVSAMLWASATAAQEPALPLGDIARKAGQDRAAAKRATKVYTNASLTPDPQAAAEPAAASAAPVGYVSATTGEVLSANEIVERSQAMVAAREKATLSEGHWRGRANTLRVQIEDFQKRLDVLRRPSVRSEAAEARNAAAVARLQLNLDRVMQQWTELEEAADVAKVPTEWLDPHPPQNSR